MVLEKLAPHIIHTGLAARNIKCFHDLSILLQQQQMGAGFKLVLFFSQWKILFISYTKKSMILPFLPNLAIKVVLAVPYFLIHLHKTFDNASNGTSHVEILQ